MRSGANRQDRRFPIVAGISSAVYPQDLTERMSKKWALTAVMLIVICWLAYQLLRSGNEEPFDPVHPSPNDNSFPGGKKKDEDKGAAEKEPAGGRQTSRVEKIISGRIVAKERTDSPTAVTPVAGARISLLSAPTTDAASDGAGYFRLSPVALHSNDLLVRAAGYGVMTRLRVPAGVDDLVIRLEKELKLQGKIIFADGSPAGGAEVLLHSAASVEADPFSRASALHGGREAEARGTSSEDGAFTIGGLSQRNWFLRVRGPGILEQVLDGVVKVNRETRPIEIVVEAGRSIRGKIVDEAGKGLAGIEVRVVTQLDVNISRTFTRKTGGEGEFLFNRLADGPCELLAGSSSDYLPLAVSQVSPGDELLLELSRGTTLNGRIIDSTTSQPIPGAKALWHSDSADAAPGADREVAADAQGRFTLRGIPRENLRIHVSAAGYLGQDLDGPLLGEDPPGGVHLVKLEPAGKITGITRSEDGEPIADALVRLEGASPTGGVFSDSYSNRQGRFSLRLDSTRAGATYAISAHHEDYLAADPVEIRITDPRRPHPETTIQLRRGSSISGRIKYAGNKSPTGKSLAGHRLMLLRTEADQLIELNRSTLSGPGGEYRFAGLEVGEYVLRSDSAGVSPYQSERLQLKEKGGLLHDIYFASERIISGRVTNREGEPLRASISATDLRDPALKRSRRMTFSDQQGNFRLGSLGPGPYRISARTSGHQPATENSFAPPGNLEFVLEQTGSVEGEVLDGGTGKPVGEFTARLIPAGGTNAAGNRPREVSFRRPSGRFLVEELAGGNYELTITANGYLALTAPVVVKPAEPANAGSLKLSAGHSAGVFVADQQGEPVANCRVDVSRKTTSEATVEGSFLTGADGKCMISGISRGTWIVRASHPGFLNGKPLELKITGPLEADLPALEITLAQGAVIRGQISRNTSPPAGGEKLVLMGPGGPRSSKPEKNGAYRFEGLAPGLYTLLHFSGKGLQGLPLEIRVEAGEGEVIRNLDGN